VSISGEVHKFEKKPQLICSRKYCQLFKKRKKKRTDSSLQLSGIVIAKEVNEQNHTNQYNLHTFWN